MQNANSTALSYTTFTYSDIALNQEKITMDEILEVSNTGERADEEIVQLYVQDLVGSITRPVKELKGFKRLSLKQANRGK